jgi:hypothetical protein
MKQLRICTIGDFQKWHSYYLMGTTQGSILNGHLHYSIPIRQHPDSIKEQLNIFKPDLIFTHMLFSENLRDMCGGELTREALHEIIVGIRRKWGSKVIMQEGDAKPEPRYSYPVNELIDLCLVNSKLYNHYSDILKVPCIHWPYFALNQETLSTGDNRFRYNVIFAGNVSPRNKNHLHYGRSEFISKLAERMQVKVFPDDKIGNTRFCTADIAVSCDAVLGIHHGFNTYGYLDTRSFQYSGAGALYFHSECDAINQFFRPNYHYVPYEHMNVDSFINQYNHYMIHNREGAAMIRKQAFEYTQKYHTAKHRIQMVLDILDGKEPQKIYLNELGE